MALATSEKQPIIKNFQRAKEDTGSPEVQIALLTERIKGLTIHFQTARKDFHSKQGLQGLVNRRRKLLQYLKDQNITSYRKLIGQLDLRDSY
ncbi:MAG: 30S ribosomal protein S15 [Proteobacteria bacterium]|nr:30S ribosomal protein S15 [Pseudomonadota bacterium]